MRGRSVRCVSRRWPCFGVGVPDRLISHRPRPLALEPLEQRTLLDAWGFLESGEADLGTNRSELLPTQDLVPAIPMAVPSLAGSVPDLGFVIGFGGTASDFSSDLAVDTNGNVYVAGSFRETADFDPSTSDLLFSSVGADDIFVAKYNDSGELVWRIPWVGQTPTQL